MVVDCALERIRAFTHPMIKIVPLDSVGACGGGKLNYFSGRYRLKLPGLSILVDWSHNAQSIYKYGFNIVSTVRYTGR